MGTPCNVYHQEGGALFSFLKHGVRMASRPPGASSGVEETKQVVRTIRRSGKKGTGDTGTWCKRNRSALGSDKKR